MFTSLPKTTEAQVLGKQVFLISTLKTNLLKRNDLGEFVQLYNPANRRHLERGQSRRPLALL